jgi:hypothetical protein
MRGAPCGRSFFVCRVLQVANGSIAGPANSQEVENGKETVRSPAPTSASFNGQDDIAERSGMQDADTSPPVPIRFVSTCPKCQRPRCQDQYSFRAVLKLLVENKSIGARCESCNEVWPILSDERDELALLLLTVLNC